MNATALRRALLLELAEFRVSGAFEDNLYRLTCIVGDLLAAGRVSLMLLDTGHGQGARLKLAALYGELPESAWKEEPRPGQGIAGQVLLTGRCLRVANISRSSWRSSARRPGDDGGFLACPVPLAPAWALAVTWRRSVPSEDIVKISATPVELAFEAKTTRSPVFDQRAFEALPVSS